MGRHTSRDRSRRDNQAAIDEARGLMAREAWEQAEALLTGLFAEGDRSFDLLVELTHCLLMLGRVDRARRFLTLAESRDGRETRVACCRGLLALTEERFAHALGHFSRSLRADGTNAEAYKWRGLCYRELDEPGRALADLNRAMCSMRDDPTLLVNRGTVHADLGELELALADFERACSIVPRHPLPHCNAGHVLLELERVDEAQEHYDRAVELDYCSADAWSGLADVFLARNERSEALRCLATALALQPDDVRAHRKLARLFVSVGTGERALPHLERVLEGGDDPEGLLLRAAAHMQRNDTEACLRDCQQARHLAPGSPLPLLYQGLALLQDRDGDHELAVRHVESAAALDQTHPIPPLVLAELAYRDGQEGLARRHLAQALALDAHLPRRIPSLAMSAGLIHHPTVAAAVRRAAQVAPGDVSTGSPKRSR